MTSLHPNSDRFSPGVEQQYVRNRLLHEGGRAQRQCQILLTSSDTTRMLPADLATVFGGITASPSSVQYGMVMAGAVLATLPPIIIFVLLQRYFVQGISMTGIKG